MDFSGSNPMTGPGDSRPISTKFNNPRKYDGTYPPPPPPPQQRSISAERPMSLRFPNGNGMSNDRLSTRQGPFPPHPRQAESLEAPNLNRKSARQPKLPSGGYDEAKEVDIEMNMNPSYSGEMAVDMSVSNSNKKKRESKRNPKGQPTRGQATYEVLATFSPEKPGESGPSTGGRSEDDQKKKKGRFFGENPLQYALLAHYMSYGSSMMCIYGGVFSIIWTYAQHYKCKIDGHDISEKYIKTTACFNTFTEDDTGKLISVCCDQSSTTMLRGNLYMGIIYLVYSVLLIIFEDTWTPFGFGLFYPNDSIFYRLRISPLAFLHIAVGILGLFEYVTIMSGVCLICTGLTLSYAVMRGETGDGGRSQRRTNANRASTESSCTSVQQGIVAACESITASFCNPCAFFSRIYNEDKISSYFWTLAFLASQIIMISYMQGIWRKIVDDAKQGLRDGNLNIQCTTGACLLNREIIKNGPPSDFAPWAKGFGFTLNLDCALILIPVTKVILKRLYNLGMSFNSLKASNDIFSKFFAHPLMRYLPLQKNIEFHKLLAGSIFILSWGHMIFHFLNLFQSRETTIFVFNRFGYRFWGYFSGAMITLAGFFIYSGAPEAVRMAKFEAFFKSHHWFTFFFFFFLFLHSRIFFWFGTIPVLLYIYERYLQTKRGQVQFKIIKVEYIAPVMAVYFKPLIKGDFKFKEGQYLYLNSPAISNQWHPFTISSAYEDLSNGPRIHLESGEEVVEVPRPSSSIWPKEARWSKYARVSQDWRELQQKSPHLLLDKSETGYFDYLSCHIKVHGLDAPVAQTWTRKLKEHLELISGRNSFPMYFKRLDARGDIEIGRVKGPEGLPILCVDGPHSAPAEHYCHYKTAMIVGAGIGLTPCASIVTSLIKYKWKKGCETPEILLFYWVVRLQEVDSFQWFIHLLTELSYEKKRAKENGQILNNQHLEVHIYVTGTDAKSRAEMPNEPAPLKRSPKKYSEAFSSPSFAAEDLYQMLLNPQEESKNQIPKMQSVNARNKLQDIWVWNGRPFWDHIFKDVRDRRQHPNIGVCFCGAPVIGGDLQRMCDKYSSSQKNCFFTLHKENF